MKVCPNCLCAVQFRPDGSAECRGCQISFTATWVAAHQYTQTGLEREGWDIPPEAA